ncbi:UvrD-helicase domain-containing protein [Peredibacter sp. HCB2-198]|uniref:UvrD-helicase domain-containing protein n=1 Tax=Peredibacter sp. HCB2-198 TaxID=3383025 RepID=UPI0038B4F195
MSRSPNAEQLLAIEHEGGVLLRAGAGSGKTFVLVEHIVYLTRKWIAQYKSHPTGSFEEHLRLKFSQVVMMTFTKKAAGEMSIRLTEKFEEIAHTTETDIELWKTANELLPMLLVTTIDGFCKKLITMGYFPHLSTESDIIFSPQRTDQVRELVESWFENYSQKVSNDLLDIVVREKRALLSAFTNVFSDPGLRLAWKKFKLEEIHPQNLDKLIEASYKLNDLPSALAAIHAMDLPEEKERGTFEKIVAIFQSSGLPEITSVEKFKIYVELFKNASRLDNRKKLPGSEAAKDGLAAVRDWLKVWTAVITDYETHFDSKILPWMNLCQELFNYIEVRLDPNQGMTFGDIEYLVSLGLENAEDRSRIQKAFSYFIVDEFQDTSDIQFRIIQNLIGEDYSKLFCVGDAKQAIYGFRGGELSVFQDCAKLVPQVRTLANNYRSLPEVINFNNSLFRTILPLGQNFEGHDPFTVNPEDQNVPSEVVPKEKGVIEIHSAELVRDLEKEDKFKNEHINRLEALMIADAIKKERETTNNVCTVLYSKLTPSGELIRALMERKIGFTAQFKIDLLDDPILGMFVCLLRRQFDSNPETKNKYPLFLFKSYFNILGLTEEVSEGDLEDFDRNVRYWGMIEAFRKFIHKLHLTNENSDINLETIQTISDLYLQDPENIMKQLEGGDNDRLSLELRSGENSGMVQIMTAHASKGLEFDAVYLAGIYTNGRSMNEGSLFGDLPGSFNWYLDIVSREKQKSPLYIFENELAKYKNFSESKRLFYVACTRAKKKLVWVDFEMPEDGFSIPKNSWILGLRNWTEQAMSKEAVTEIQRTDFNSEELLNSQGLPQLPLFFHDPVGIFPKGEGDSELLIAAELSVTRLNSLLDCPRKFYLSNILKVTEPEESSKVFVEEEGEELATVIRSSSERGTYIHAQIAEGIMRNFVVPRQSFGTDMQGPIQWALDLLKETKDEYELIPEKQIKFRFFNFMISGIPDLVLMPKGKQKAQIWDFKTGRITQENLSHYWLQLSTYAYALYELGQVEHSSEIELILCFVDQQKTLKEVVSFEKCRKDLYPIWRSQNEPWKVNLDHCSQCSYGSICPR